MPGQDKISAAHDFYRYRLLMDQHHGAAEAESAYDPQALTHLGQALDRVEQLTRENARARYQLESLVRIGRALAAKHDWDVLLRSILLLSKAATGADGGSIYLVENLTPDVQVLRFKYSHTHSKALPYEERILALDASSIAGYVAMSGKAMNIADVYNLTSEDVVSFNSSFDRTYNYRSKSMLVVPMRNRQGGIIGVIQLINCKDLPDCAPGFSAYHVKLRTTDDYNRKVVTFPAGHREFMETIAAQAAITLENRRMLQQIEQQFDKFVRATVSAIESRDKDTSNHSERVAASCLEIAQAINQWDQGRFAATSFSPTQLRELEYAALLHDYGKVYLDPQIFLKDKKLAAKELEALRLRLGLIYRSIELAALRARPGGGDPIPEPWAQQLATLQGLTAELVALNEPSVVESDADERVRRILALAPQFEIPGEEGLPLLTPDEAEKLSIRKGTLTYAERQLIESHVEHSHTVLSSIPWPDEYRNIPAIAYDHHELLDGSGYCRHIKDPSRIAIQSQIMTVADIWDALASDRVYKKAIPFEKCCAILRDEAARGRLDPELVEIMIMVKSRPRGPA